MNRILRHMFLQLFLQVSQEPIQKSIDVISIEIMLFWEECFTLNKVLKFDALNALLLKTLLLKEELLTHKTMVM